MTDFHVDNHGSLFILWADTPEALDHITTNVSEEAQWWGRNGLVVKHRYIVDLVMRLQDEGFEVS